MRNSRKMLWAVSALLVLLFFVTISSPNLLRSRMSSNEATLVSKLRSAQMTEQHDTQQGANSRFMRRVAAPDKKLIHNAELGLMVGDVRAAAEEIRRLTELNYGEIDKREITETNGGFLSATLLGRVPASGLERALAAFRRVACELNASRSAHAMSRVISMTTKRTSLDKLLTPDAVHEDIAWSSRDEGPCPNQEVHAGDDRG